MFAGFGAIISKMFDILKTHHIVMFFSCILLCCPSADLRVQVVAVFVMQFQQPSHMIDTGDQFSSAFQLVFHAQFFQQFLRTYLYAVAQTYGTDLCVSLHIAGQHRHRVSVVQKQGVRAGFFHISGKFFHHRDSTKCTHDTADPQCICDSLTQTVFFRDLKVGDGARIIAAYLDRIHYKVGIPQSLFSVFHTEIGFDRCSGLVDILIDRAEDDL